MTDLPDFFSRLNKTAAPGANPPVASEDSRRDFTFSSPSNNSHPPFSNYHEPSVSSPIPSPSPNGPQPRHPDNIMSLNTTPAPNTPGGEQPQNERTSNLLNLLKFNQAGSNSGTGQSRPFNQRQESNPAQPVSASDLVASFSRQASNHLAQKDSTHRSNASPDPTTSGAPSQDPKAVLKDNPQHMLLNLLKRPQQNGSEEGQSGSPAELSAAQRSVTQRGKPSPVNAFGQSEAKRSLSFHAPQPTQKPTLPAFTYVNPFEKLEATSRNQSPRPEPSAKDVAKPPSVSTVSNKRSNGPSPLPQNDRGVDVSEEQGDLAAQEEATETVAEALTEVAEIANRDAQEALADTNPTQDEIKDAVHEAATEIQDALEDGQTKSELDKKVSSPITSALKDTADKVTTNGVADDWEDAATAVPVYNLPMRPFVTIDVKGITEPSNALRQEVIKIASVKKEFDQLDRNLTTATANLIVYAAAKGGGFRVIRQDDGNNKMVFKGVDNQIFNVSANSPPPLSPIKDHETVLATSIGGSVCWTKVPVNASGDASDSFNDADLDASGFILPPPPSTEDNTSKSQLKTRAKLSFRHQGLFAVARGKSIHFVNPNVAGAEPYTNPKTHLVDSQKYFSDWDLNIATGKAGKDFAFSADDTIIVSLDKHGKLKFWDTAPFITQVDGTKIQGSHKTIELTDPVMSLLVSSSNYKAWPTSVQFVDKERSFMKGLALRYLLVGMKQNHTIQLWDIGLGKAVQELSLPHESETDPICSISYHAKSSIIAVGHPTRNSIYLIHLSAPRYTLPAMPQNRFVHRLAMKDPLLPRPESTAIMSGIREISLDSIGRLRSLDILSPHQITLEKDEYRGEETVFEVYAMHSRGVTCVSLKKHDFGWDHEGKVLNNHDALSEGLVSVEPLQEGPSGEADAPQGHPKISEPSAPKPQPEDLNNKAADSSKVIKRASRTAISENSSSDHPNKKKRNKHLESMEDYADSGSASRSERDADPREQLKGEIPSTSFGSRPTRQKSPNFKQQQYTSALNQEAPDSMTQSQILDTNEPPTEHYSVSAHPDFHALLRDNLGNLYRRIDEDKRVQEAASSAKQDAVLRLVSSTLTDNVEKSLSRIVSKNLAEKLLPSISTTTSSALDRQLPKAVAQQLNSSFPKELKTALSQELTKAFKDQSLLQAISEQVTSKIANSIDKQFKAFLEQNVISNFRTLAAESARKSVSEVERQVNEQLRLVEVQRQNDVAKIDHLTNVVGDLTKTIQAMATAQSEFHKEVIRPQQQLNRPESIAREPSPPARDEELDSIRDLMYSGKFEEGTIKVSTYVHINLMVVLTVLVASIRTHSRTV